MNCPKCGAISDNNTCSICKIDILQYSLVNAMSINAYNKGLSLAKENDISNAIVELTKAIKYDGENITALNLLGLCYDRVGRVSDASKYWIRSCMVLEDNIANDYLKIVEDNVTKTEKANESIKMYNQGLIYFSQGNMDIAIIQLRNAVDRNHTFVDAINLLALAYMKEGQKDKAIHMLKKVIKIDVRNDKAIRYLNELDYNINKVTYKKRPEVNNTDKKKNEKINASNHFSGGKIAISFALGLIAMLIVNIFLVYPNIRLQSNYSNNQAENVTQEQEDVDGYKDKEIAELNSQIKSLEEENKTLDEEYTLLNNYLQLYNAENLVNAGDYINASNIIYQIDADRISADQIDKYKTLKDKAYPEASSTLYESGVNKYNMQNYEAAITDLELSVRYGGTVKSYYPNTLYYLGRCYEALGDIDKALLYYQKVVDEYPDNDIVYSVKNRINVISQ